MADLGGLLDGAEVSVDADVNLAFDWGPIGIIIGGVLAFLLVVFVIAYYCGRGMCRCCDYTCCKGEALQSSKRRDETRLRRDYMTAMTANNSQPNSHFDTYNRTLPTTVNIPDGNFRPQDLVVYQNHQMAYMRPPQQFQPYQSVPYHFDKRDHPFGSHRPLPLPSTSYQNSHPRSLNTSRSGGRNFKKERRYHIPRNPNHSSYI